MVEYKFPATSAPASASLDASFSAMADPTRRAILARLAQADARVTEIAGDFPVSLNAISKHIKILERARLVRRTVQGREHILTLNAEAMAGAAEWIDFYRQFWEDRLASLERFVTRPRKNAKKGTRS
jgi:DNA-binding transcriptional ArsR family regulator